MCKYVALYALYALQWPIWNAQIISIAFLQKQNKYAISLWFICLPTYVYGS